MKTAKVLVLCLFSFGLVSCSNNGSVGFTMNVKSVSSAVARFKNFSKMMAEPFTFGRTLAAPGFRAAGDYGAATVGSGGLESYKLYIKRIQLCESLTTSGSGYSGIQGCSEIYSNEQDDYDSFDVEAAGSVGEGKYFDILSETDRDALTTQASVTAGTYNAGIIDWYRPVKVNGTVTLGNTNELHTKTCPTSGACDVSGLGSGPSEESIIDLNNGGTWMKFLKPFTVADGDDVTVDLAFDLENKVFGGDSVSNGAIRETSGCTAVGSGYCGIYVPILRLSPVPRLSTESTMVETYEMDSADSTEWKLRVDVYYNSEDTDKSILAADLYPIPTATAAHSVAANVYVYTAEESGGVTTFKGYDGSTQLTFTRGDSGTGTLTCPAGATLEGCSGTTTMSWSTRFVGTL